MSDEDKTCDRCLKKYTTDLPAPGFSRFWGRVQFTTWRITFNRVVMNTWENAVNAAETVGSSTYTPVGLCSSCWGDVLHFIQSTRTKP